MTGPRIIFEDEPPRPRAPQQPPPAAAAAPAPRLLEEETGGRMEIAEPAAPPEPVVPDLPRRGGPLKWAAWGLLTLLVGSFALQAWQFVAGRFAEGPVAGVIASALVAIGLGGPLLWVWFELRALARLKSVERLQGAVLRGAAVEREQALRLVQRTVKALPRGPQIDAEVQEFRARLQPHHTGPDVLFQARRTLLVPCDADAVRAVRRATAQTFGLAAISPTPLTDTLIFIARALRLLREVAGAYGQRPGAAGIYHLVGRIFREAGALGATELAAQAAAELGGSALEKMGLTAATSGVAAWRMARFGMLAMQACRPIPFAEEERPRLPDLVPRPGRPPAPARS